MVVIDARRGILEQRACVFVISVLKSGGVVVFPTDTAYGLGVDPRVVGAAKKIFAIKGRDDRKPLSVTVTSTSMAKRYGVFSPTAARLARKYWPGALTLVVPLRKTEAAGPLESLQGGNSVGLRYPDHPIAIALAKKLGFPITSTSANRSGAPACYTMREFLRQFCVKDSTLTPKRSNLNRDGQESPLPDLFINAGPLPRRPTSTVVDCTGKTPKILRQGAVKINPNTKAQSPNQFRKLRNSKH